MTATDTGDLIKKLSDQAGRRHGATALSVGRLALLAVVLSFGIAVAMVLVFIGVRQGFVGYIESLPFQRKLASTLLLAAGAFALLRRAARPGARLRIVALLPGAALFACAGISDATGFLGGTDASIYLCIGSILVLSAPGFLLLLWALRTGAPTRPSAAGATAGLLAGALGAAAYTLACLNDGGLFLVAWYPVAILIMTTVGAAIGRFALAW